MLGLLVYWLVILAALMIAFNSLELAYVTELIGRKPRANEKNVRQLRMDEVPTERVARVGRDLQHALLGRSHAEARRDERRRENFREA